MEITRRQSSQLKSIAILMMLCLHLFNRDYKGLFEPLIFVGEQPLSYYISLFCDACVPIFAFVSGYGLYFKYQKDKKNFKNDNFVRLRKLYINYWIIILIFPVALGHALGFEKYPGSATQLLLNLTAIHPTYNGAWWFLTIYILFVLTAELWFYLLDRINPFLLFFALVIIYLVGFYFRVYQTDLFANSVLKWVQNYTALFFCTLFQFMIGGFALKYKWNSFISGYFQRTGYTNLIICLLMIALILFHAVVPNFIIAPFTGLAFIFLYTNLHLSEKIQNGIDFFAPHSTNIWLTHMFFYLIFFPDFIYGFKYPPVIFLILILICVLCSYLINFVNQNVQKIFR